MLPIRSMKRWAASGDPKPDTPTVCHLTIYVRLMIPSLLVMGSVMVVFKICFIQEVHISSHLWMVSQVWNDDDDIILFYQISVRGCGGERCSPLLRCSLIVEYFYI